MRTLSIAALALFIAGCGVELTSVHLAHRSGPLDDDFVAEPLTADVLKYEHALEISNSVLDALERDDFAGVCAQYLAPPLDTQIDEMKLREFMESAVSTFGPWKEQRPLQWNFVTDRTKGIPVLCSIKIVEHERGKVRYAFLFPDDGKYERLIGLHRRPWKGTLPPGEF